MNPIFFLAPVYPFVFSRPLWRVQRNVSQNTIHSYRDGMKLFLAIPRPASG